jgi:phosphodiesterase/alkaline phosphatase D-like protein
MLPHKSHQPTRRTLLALGAGSVAACSAPVSQSFKPDNPQARGTFAHGVASGDPATNSVVLWTRVTPNFAPDEEEVDIEVICRIGTAPDLSDARTSVSMARSTRDYCVKAIPAGLAPGTTYYYQFEVGDQVSAVGQTRTLPEGDTPLARLAFVSCANWQHGYFHAYDQIARQHADTPFNALIHLGDYFYEYGADDYLDDKGDDFDRRHEPAHEIISLSDYRTRHAQYRTDPNLQAVTALMPLIPIWDDHESSNDSFVDGAENHDPATEGDWDTRKAVAMRAYYDWMPIRDADDPTTLWRSFSFGDLLTLTCVETRLAARAEPIIIENHVEEISADPEAFKQNVLGDPSREMFGPTQQSFILDSFKRSKAGGQPWRLLANQVIMGRLLTTDMEPYIDQSSLSAIAKDWPGVYDFMSLSGYNVPVYPDSWDGYPAAREAFYAALEEAGIQDMLVLTGDAHEFWANHLTRTDGTRVGAEIVTSSVSSKTLTAYLGGATADYSLLLTKENADAKYYEARYNGFTTVELTPRKAHVQMWAIPNVREADYEVNRVAAFNIRPSGKSLNITDPKGLSTTQRLLFSDLV